MDTTWWLFFAVGMGAQLVDGALGMAFGVTATTFLLSFGVAPAQASAMVHIAEIFTTAASGASHWAQRNIDWAIVKRLAIPGTVGGAIGATVLSNVDGKIILPFITLYLAIMGLIILFKAVRLALEMTPNWRGVPVVGFFGGLLDAIGGGGWGPIVTSTLIGGGHAPRFVIGSVNLTEFLVTVVTSAAFAVSLGFMDILPVIPFILGGLIVAPFAGYLTRIIPARILMAMVGCLILGLSLRSLLKLAGWL
ncbi:sulfite exporter TauE/SafE family protein [Pseudorhodoplanes sp.]|uniref:sulfite exporter TauE/SafE family protein n=1 Tax=Pseudorhodoplanes sp. TaxID=1934341 RepID=UPI00391957DC